MPMQNFLSQTDSPDAVKVHLFCDNARYYRNKYVKDYLASSKLKSTFCPLHSPNLNPIWPDYWTAIPAN